MGRPAPDGLPHRRRARRPHAVGHRDWSTARRPSTLPTPVARCPPERCARGACRSATGRPRYPTGATRPLSRRPRRVDRVAGSGAIAARPGGAGPRRGGEVDPDDAMLRPAAALPLPAPAVRARRGDAVRATLYATARGVCWTSSSTAQRVGDAVLVARAGPTTARASSTQTYDVTELLRTGDERARRRPRRRLVRRHVGFDARRAGTSLRRASRAAVRAAPRVRRRLA